MTIDLPGMRNHERLRNYPAPETWDHHVENDARAHPRKVPREFMLIPTTCFNCESACGLLAYVEKKDLSVTKVTGNPAHPGSRGRNCAKGPATINQLDDPERILHPLRRAGERGAGKWERVTWDEALDDIAARIRQAILDDRHDEVLYHVGRPGEDGFAERFLQAWGVDGHNSHTNICSSGARFGYTLWGGYDRPSPDHANAKVILLLSSHLETGHYFNPHAQRIMEAKQNGAKLVVLDPRMSNTASHADLWLAPWPGSEAAILLAVASYLIRTRQLADGYIRRWVNWQTYLERLHPDAPRDYETFLERLDSDYAGYTFEYAAREARIPEERIEELARIVAGAGTRLAAHVWRAAAAGNLGGWQVARSLFFLNVLTGSVGTEGGTSPNGWNKFVAHGPNMPDAHERWNELLWPREYPLSTNEMSFLLPHFLADGRARLAVYFSRVYNPVWTNPDGFMWMETLTDPDRVGCHVALTPTWSETAAYADYVLPMGHSTERHDTHSYETHAGRWLGFRQPVRRVAMEKTGQAFTDTRDTNPGEVWEENEFWFELSWRIDPDGALGIRKYFESPYRPGEKVTVDEYYRYVFENSVPGLPEKAKEAGLTPLEYMRKYGVVEIDSGVYRLDERPLTPAELDGAEADEQGVLRRPTTPDSVPPLIGEAGAVGVRHEDGTATQGWLTPSRKLEIYSTAVADFGWPEHATPGYVESHVSWHRLDRDAGDLVLMPTFRLPTLIHTRSGNAKYLNEISNTHPLWVNPEDAAGLVTGDLATDDLVRVHTEIGHFVARVWVTSGIRPGVVALSHHMGRWRLHEQDGSRWVSGLVDLRRGEEGVWRLRYRKGVRPFASGDADSSRIDWDDPGVHQNLAFAVHPDPLSGMHCWHQKVRLAPVEPGDEYGDVVVDTRRSRAVYREWLEMTRPGPNADGLRRPEFLMRPVKPKRRAFHV
ncbi:molybdopterin-dependent oxidoreductase [Actinomadura madurae]|uniref:molybdopterin-dependent oxidoreductase n=1 Tax=Actinomadura madurae TaxID=1993 RepID=UPI0020D1F770|nr:molybdopterin-dependent oxidoreductase [Actinomadura madurae]MCP9951343.1 molybdopterin-dependent oxidoreductase [Actinomadura madurae]MCP9980576.1 molybdopterin-dependent oxidoreductase [Actinomadura madurae]MCQ0007908.1 molybdopterin-dependent oxidoreductase [Actinomadura madurae]